MGVLLDSGSKPHSFISSSLYERLLKAGMGTLRRAPITGRLITGASFACEGFLFLRLRLRDDLEIFSKFYILNGLPVDVVIGREDLLRFDLLSELQSEIAIADEIVAGYAEEDDKDDSIEVYPLKHSSAVNYSQKDWDEALLELCRRYDGVFSDSLEGIDPAKLPPMNLELNTNIKQFPKSMNLSPRRFSASQQVEIDRQVEELVAAGIIEETDSEYASQVLLVKKPENRWRFCIDFRFLNSITKGTSWPLPRIQDLIDGLKGNAIFGKFDLSQAYHQIALTEEASRLSAFKTARGIYRWKRVPFGLKGAPSYFQGLMASKVLKGLIGRTCLCYLDDVIVFARTRAEFDSRVEEILQRFVEFNIKVKLSKTELGLSEITYLGSIINKDGHRPTDERKEALSRIQRPTTVTQLRSFLGIVNFIRDYIPRQASLAAPLHALTGGRQKTAKVKWNPTAIAAFENLKSAVQAAPSLRFLKEEGELFLYTDASDYAVGGVLTQVQFCSETQSFREFPIIFLSKTLTETQRRWSVTEREMWAIVYCVRAAHYYIGGVHCTVRTDHRALPFQEKQSASAKVERWKLSLQEYDLTFEYIPGETNCWGDAMSRITTEIFPVEEMDIAFGAMEDRIEDYSHDECIRAVHGRGFGHWGCRATHRILNSKGVQTWPGMRRDIARVISSCRFCQFVKSAPPDSTGLKFSVSSKDPGVRWALDTKHMYTDKRGVSYLLILIDLFSRFVYAGACERITGDDVAFWLDGVIVDIGESVKSILHDPGKEFNNAAFKAMLARNGVEVAWKEQNAVVERVIDTVRTQIAAVEYDFPGRGWSAALPRAVRNYNCKHHDGIDAVPYEVWVGSPTDSEVQARAIGRARRALARTALSKDSSKVAKLFQKDSWILRKIEGRRKLAPDQHRWSGPYRVVEATPNTVSFVNKEGLVSSTHVSNVKEFIVDVGVNPEEIAIAGSDYYIVEGIIDHNPKEGFNMRNGRLTVVFKGYPPDEYYIHENPDLLHSVAFVKYVETNPSLQPFLTVREVR